MAYKRDLSTPLSPTFGPGDPPKKKKKAKMSELTPAQQKKITYMKNHSGMSSAALQNAMNEFKKSNQKKKRQESKKNK